MGIISGKSLAKRLGLSEMIIGLTVVSIGSSLPEIFVATTVAIRNIEGIEDLTPVAVGNIIGNCLVQITLWFGIIVSSSVDLRCPRRCCIKMDSC